MRVTVVDVSIPANHAALASHRGSDSLHVFSGFFSHPLVWAGFHTLKSSQARLAIYSEAPEQPWHTRWIKRLRGRWLAVRYAKRFAFVLAIGGIGCDFFEQIGFPKEKIVPFGYYLAVPPLATESARPQDGLIRFVSAGQLIHRKGIDLLIKACEALPKTGWHLDIYGNGPERRRLEQLAASLGLADRIAFHGVVENRAVREAISIADYAILPSRFDGWGALVNEALAAGTSVICSSGCGVASLIQSTDSGAVFPAGTIDNISKAMAAALATPPIDNARRERIHAKTARMMSASAAAAQFIKLVNMDELIINAGRTEAH